MAAPLNMVPPLFRVTKCSKSQSHVCLNLIFLQLFPMPQIIFSLNITPLTHLNGTENIHGIGYFGTSKQGSPLKN